MAKDVCEGLGFSDAFHALRMVDGDEKDGLHFADVTGRSQEMIIVSEAGLYSLILRSQGRGALVRG